MKSVQMSLREESCACVSNVEDYGTWILDCEGRSGL